MARFMSLEEKDIDLTVGEKGISPEMIEAGIERLCPADKLVRMARELASEEQEPPKEEIKALAKELMDHKDFLMIRKLCTKVHLFKETPLRSSDVPYSSHLNFSIFHPIHDPKLEEAIGKYLGDDQDKFVNRVSFEVASMLDPDIIGLIVLNHGLEESEVDKIIKYFCLGNPWLRPVKDKISPEESAMTLYSVLRLFAFNFSRFSSKSGEKNR